MESAAQHFLSNPRKSANFLSVLLFAWTIPIFRRGWKKSFDGSSVYETLAEDRSSYLGDRLEKNWQHERKSKKKPSLVKVILRTFWLELVFLGVLCFVNEVVIRLILPYWLDNLLTYFRKNSEMSHESAVQYGTAIFVVTVISSLGTIHYYFHALHYAMKVRVAICSLIYRQALRLSQKALMETAPGKLVNLLSNDVNRFDAISEVLHSLWASPLLTIIAVYILWIEIRWAGILGMAIIFLVVPLQSYVGSLSKIFRFQIALRTDERVRFMDEIIAGVQVIKFYVWEKPFAKLIAAARSAELEIILKNTYVRSLYMTFTIFTTRMALYCTILSIVLMYGRESISVSKIFMISYMFTSISRAMCQLFVRACNDTAEVLVAIKRVQMFLEYEENDREKNIERIDCGQLESQNSTIVLKNISAAWSHISNDAPKKTKKKQKKIGSYSNGIKSNGVESPPISTLRDIDIEFGKGKLIGVIGEVGSGKTSLIQVILGELTPSTGSIRMNGSISYSSQEPWNFAATVRDNILFGDSLDRLRYDAVLKCTALLKDLKNFGAGDQTMVGERGISLSGGQKARINLARAVYRKADIYLLDDPLSAVDAHVGSHLYNECIGPRGFLARQNATRILATHQVHFLKDADWIVVLRQGKVEAQGTYQDILKSGIDFASILAHSNNECDEDVEALQNCPNPLSSRSTASMRALINGLHSDEPDEESELLTNLEESSKGKVKGPLLWKYLNAAQRPFMLVFLVVSILGSQILASAADVWASYWIRNEESRIYYSSTHNLEDIEAMAQIWTTDTYAYIYGAILCLLLGITLIRSVAYFKFCARASHNLHENMFNSLITTTMRFFDVNPSGRILNRFSKDIGSVDETLPRILLDAIQINLSMVGAIAVTLYVNWKFGVIILLLGIGFMFMRHIYLKVSKDLGRLEGMTKSPVYTHITATLDGLSTIRAFNAQPILQNQFDNHQNMNTAIFHAAIGLSHGFGISLSLMALVFIGCVIYILLMTDEVTGDRVGLAITQSLALTNSLQWGVRQGTEVSNQLMSVERVMEYGGLEPEQQPEKSENLSKDWPRRGMIEFRKVYYRHFADAEPVLRQISFIVQPKEKIGIVGRTGAGKSSLIGCLFRLALVDGDILIDDKNTEDIELELLRSHISIIPQDPVLFSGTLRRNLDPFEEYSDDAIWQTLDNVELKESFSAANGLQTEVAAHGSNFSVGQRQLLCLARALLRNNRILVLDEATANVDPRTDHMIQQTIREKFADCTVLTVAHRLHTIIDSDRIMVLDTGAIVEFDEPHTLLQNKKGVFYSMVEATGPQELEKLSHAANEKYENSRKLRIG